MKHLDFIIFFTIVLAVYTSANYYIFIRGSQALQAVPRLKTFYYITFVIFFISYLAAMFLVRSYPSPLSAALDWVGSFWLGAMVYFFFFVIFWDLLRAVNHFIPFYPSFVTANYPVAKLYTLGFSILVVIVILIAGFINATHPVIKELNIEINKKAGNHKNFRIVSVSDIHIGEIIGRSRVSKLVERINKLEPDLVLFPGDILDQDLNSVLKYKSGEPLKKIKAKYGVYAITGNHEYIGGIRKAATYIESLNIVLLRDSTALIDSSLYLIGREDRDSRRFAGIERKPLEELLNGVNKNLPLILLDHQPFHLEDAEKNGIDLQLSGHTHHGQLWPFGYITNKIYEVSWGYKRKGGTQYYVSSGFGTWGPPIRTGNTPEIVLINLSFK
jgi:predicted MPP superfamily phosphohydrolase